MAEPPYNPIFTRFVEVERGGDEQLQGLVAYGLYKVAKREWIREHFAPKGRRPTEEELAAYASTWTESRLQGLQEQAETAMAQFANTVVTDNAPAIREDALRGSFGQTVWRSMVANAVYTLVLVLIVILLRANGVDLLSIAGSVGQPSPR